MLVYIEMRRFRRPNVSCYRVVCGKRFLIGRLLDIGLIRWNSQVDVDVSQSLRILLKANKVLLSVPCLAWDDRTGFLVGLRYNSVISLVHDRVQDVIDTRPAGFY
jgi:hypothetical protein